MALCVVLCCIVCHAFSCVVISYLALSYLSCLVLTWLDFSYLVFSCLAIRTFRGHKGAITACSFQPNNKQLVSSSIDGYGVVCLIAFVVCLALAGCLVMDCVVGQLSCLLSFVCFVSLVLQFVVLSGNFLVLSCVPCCVDCLVLSCIVLSFSSWMAALHRVSMLLLFSLVFFVFVLSCLALCFLVFLFSFSVLHLFVVFSRSLMLWNFKPQLRAFRFVGHKVFFLLSCLVSFSFHG